MPKTTVAAIATVAALLTTSGCSAIDDTLGETEVGSVEASETSSLSLVVTRQWGVVDGLLSVVVENVTDRTLRYAEGVITARTDDNEVIAASLEIDGSCCEVVDLAPGEEYGFYLDVGDRASEISRVDVGYRNLAWVPAGEASAGSPGVEAAPVRLDRDASGAVVRAELVSDGPYDEVVAQAFLTDEAGEFLAVVSGRWSCLVDGRRAIRMQLFRPLPKGAQVDRVTVHPVSDDPTRERPDCPQPGAAL